MAVPKYPYILSSYNPETDFDELERLKIPGFKRWNGGVDLYQTGLPCNDVLRINSDATDDDILSDLVEFKRRNPNGLFCLRFDVKDKTIIPPVSHAALPDKCEDILVQIRDFENQGISTSLWKYDGHRYERNGAASISFVAKDKIAIDLVGPGYDGANITKGFTDIPVRITTRPHAPSPLELAEGGGNSSNRY